MADEVREIPVDMSQKKLSGEVHLVSRGYTPLRKRGKESGNCFYSSLFHRSVQCGTNHSAVFCHMSAVITTSVGNYKV